jgi:putative transposase
MLDEYEALVRTLLDAKPDMTLYEMQSVLARQGVVVQATSTIMRWRRRAGLTRKKDPESCRAGSAGRGPRSPAMACMAALHGRDEKIVTWLVRCAR